MNRAVRHRLLVGLLLAGAPALASAQTSTRVGPVVGVNIASFGGDVDDLGYISFVGGVGLEVQSFTASLRYDYGLSGLLEDGLVDVYNRTIPFVVGYGFRIKP